MTDEMIAQDANPAEPKTTLRALERATARGTTHKHYSKIIRWMRFALPAMAIAILVVALSWSGMEDAVAPMKQEKSKQAVGKNELIKPRFESQDKDQQPYTITADRAYQNSENLDVIILENPVADVSLKDGTWVALEALSGEYRQSAANLSLERNVKMFHDAGYTLTTDTIVIDITGEVAETDSDVEGQGPAGQIYAKGLKAIGSERRLIFKGPAKLILNEQLSLP